MVPTSRHEAVTWKRTETQPQAEWVRENFDDSAWPEVPGGFGTRGTPGAVVRSEWRSSEIWLRRMSTLREADLKTLALSVHHDEDAEIYLNGILAARIPGFVSDYDEVEISEAAPPRFGPARISWLSTAGRRPAANTSTSESFSIPTVKHGHLDVHLSLDPGQLSSSGVGYDTNDEGLRALGHDSCAVDEKCAFETFQPAAHPLDGDVCSGALHVGHARK